MNKESIQERYFAGLVYSLANEDSLVEYGLLPENSNSVLCVAGSGARVLPLLAKNPEKLTIIDLSQEQLFLTEIRIAAAKALSREEFLYFMGYPCEKKSMPSVERRTLMKRLVLSESCREYWMKGEGEWNARGFIYLGRWEQHFQKLSKVLRGGLRIHLEKIFEATSLPEQNLLFKKHFPFLRWGIFIRLAASRFVFNRFLYKGRFSGSQKDYQNAEAPWQFIDRQFKGLFQNQLLRKNYFLQSLLLGKMLFEEGFPLEARPEIFEKIKSSRTKIEFQKTNLVTAMKSQSFDFCSLSDTLSYLKGEDLAELRANAKVSSQSQIVFRSFLRVPEGIEQLPWRRNHLAEEQALKLDCTGVYQFFIYNGR